MFCLLEEPFAPKLRLLPPPPRESILVDDFLPDPATKLLPILELNLPLDEVIRLPTLNLLVLIFARAPLAFVLTLCLPLLFLLLPLYDDHPKQQK